MGVKPQAEAPHSAPVAPRGALRRRLRRRTTCTARARTQRHRSVAARARAGPTWASERISSVARALQGARRKGRAGRWHPERLSSDAPEAGRSGAEARARAVATDRLDKFLDKWVDLLMLSAGPPEGGFVPKPPFHREHQDFKALPLKMANESHVTMRRVVCLEQHRPHCTSEPPITAR